MKLLHRSALFILLVTQGITAEPLLSGLIGGQQFTTPRRGYAATVSTSGSVTSLPLDFPQGEIITTALNNNGLGLIGGFTGSDLFSEAYSAFVSSAQTLQEISGILASRIRSVAINDSNVGLIGGFKGIISTPFPYAAFVTPGTGQPTVLNISPNQGSISQVALNSSSLGLIGGVVNDLAYAAFVMPNLALPTVIAVTGDAIVDVALNDMGFGLVGGSNGANAYAAFVSQFSTEPMVISLPDPSNIDIDTVAINNSNVGLIGGSTPTSAYASFVFPYAAPQSIALPMDGIIKSVAINDFNQGLIGGFTGDRAYAAFVSPNSAPLSLPGLPNGQINSVAINNFNQGLIGGETFDTDAPYAAIVSPSGMVVPLNLGFALGRIDQVAINAFFLSQIPTQGLKGNNLRFADYINENAQQDVFYFIPALIDGSLTDALESAAPTRNMISFNTVLQNSFYLTTNLSAHLRGQRLIHARQPNPDAKNIAALETEEELLASRCFPKGRNGEKRCGKTDTAQPPVCKQKKFTIWVDAIGALAYQKAQHETPGFNPSTGGATLAFDAKVAKTMTVGGGASYFYTHVHEKSNQGHSQIQQEDLFLYGSWEPNNFYIDLGIWGGLFQTKQTRNIHMTEFTFKSTSKPDGWQLVPHLELGWLATAYRTQKTEITWNLLGMLDWANGWQDKYKEKGSGPFNFQQKSHHGSLLRAEGGLRFSETLFFQTWNLIFQEKGSYVNIQSFHAGKMQAFLIGSPGSFTLQTLTHAQNLGLIQFSITAAPYKCCLPTSMILYQGEFGSGYQSHQLNLEFSWNF